MDATDSNKDLAVEPFDQGVLFRIVTATGFPLHTDDKALQSDLKTYYRIWVLQSGFGPRAAKKGIKRLTELIGWTAEGARLLREDDNDRGYIQELWATHGSGYPPLLPQIEQLGALLGKVSLEHGELDGSPLENLTGVFLPETFRIHFNRPPGVSRNRDTGKLDGPYIRFAERVCIEFGIPCSRETIDSARKRHRAKPEDR
jgi:hypothetical protein